MRLLLSVIILLTFATYSFAANHYIRSGATGTGTGADWTNALTAWPTTFIRGDSYYFADGAYGQVVISTAISGSLYIYIKKAVSTDHGTSTGWLDSYGDGQAIFTGAAGLSGIIKIITSYVIFDGVVGSGSNPATYGFKIAIPTNCNQSDTSLGAPPTGYSGTLDISNITISHFAIDNCGFAYSSDGGQDCFFSNPKSGANLTISHNWFSNAATNVSVLRTNGVEVSDNYFNKNWSSPTGTHGQQMSFDSCSNIVIKNNYFKDSATFVLGAHANVGSNTGWQIYNNIVDGVNPEVSTQLTGCFTGVSGLPNTVLQGQFHHNTFYNVNCGGRGAFFVGNITLTPLETYRSYAYNNIFYNVANARMDNVPASFTPGAIVHDYNAYFSTTGFNTEEHIQTGSSDPFANSSGGNYHLEAHTTPGLVQSSPYDVDYDGVPFVNPDRGAYEFPNTGVVNGVCGSASGQSFGDLTSSSPNLCYTGTVASFLETLPTGWTWGCNGYGGGTSTSGTACSATFSGDTTTPVTTWITSTPQAITVNSLAISGTASDTGGVVGCKYRIGSAPNAIYGTMLTGTTAWSGTAIGFANGANNLYVACYDAAGNYGTVTAPIVVNYTVPAESTLATCVGCTSLKLGESGGVK